MTSRLLPTFPASFTIAPASIGALYHQRLPHARGGFQVLVGHPDLASSVSLHVTYVRAPGA